MGFDDVSRAVPAPGGVFREEVVVDGGQGR